MNPKKHSIKKTYDEFIFVNEASNLKYSSLNPLPRYRVHRDIPIGKGIHTSMTRVKNCLNYLRNTDIGDKEVTFTYNKVKHTFRLNADEASKLINLYEKMSDVIIKYKQPVEADFFLLKNSFFKIVEEYKQVLREIASKEILNFKWSNCSRVEFEGDNTNIVPASIMYEVNTVNNIVEANNNIKNISKVLIRSIDKTLSKIKEKTL